MTNKAKEVLARIHEMSEEKNKSLAEIQKKIDNERKAEAAAQMAIDKAVSALDFDANHKAQADLAAAAERRALLQRRADQLMKGKLVTEEESDQTIESLLKYEEDLSAVFEAEITAPLASLCKIYTSYAEAIREAERAIGTWTQGVHPNYRNRGTVYPNGTDRADHPVPVRKTEYRGCDKSLSIQRMLEKLGEL